MEAKRLRWGDDMKVGAEPIDQQHERLVKMLNDLQDQLVIGLNQMNLRRLVLELVSYTRYHFHTEETLMRARGWPDCQRHTAAHNTYRTQLFDLERRVLQGTGLAAAREIEALLLEFIREHMLGTDRDTWIGMKSRGLL